jgi:hypothetical protein
MSLLMAQIADYERDYWAHYWDTAQKAWFEAAIRDKAILIPEVIGFKDFRHFWGGSTGNTDPGKSGDPRVNEFL